MTRFALPCERSMVAGGTTRTVGGHADKRLDEVLGAAFERVCASGVSPPAKAGRELDDDVELVEAAGPRDLEDVVRREPRPRRRAPPRSARGRR